MADREHGFIVIQRRVQSSAIWRSLTGEQRSVFLSLLLLANWGEDRFMYGTEWVEVGRGELAHSLETIAEHAAVSVKVVRTTVAKLIAGQVLSARMGTHLGTGPRVLTVLNYNKHQDMPAEPGTATGTTGARLGHGTGTTGALREQDQQDQPVFLSPREAGSADRRTIQGQAEALAGLYPASTAVLARLRDQGINMRHADSHDTRARVETLIARVTVDVAVSRISAAFPEKKRTTLGWYEPFIEGPKLRSVAVNPKAMAPVGQDWEAKL